LFLQTFLLLSPLLLLLLLLLCLLSVRQNLTGHARVHRYLKVVCLC